MNVNLGSSALQVSHLLSLAALLVAAGVGHRVGHRYQIGIVNSLVEMLWAGLLAARLAFIVDWFDLYWSVPWSMLDIRDGGFTLWAGLLAASVVALWRAWHRPALRQPLLWGLMAGGLAWGAMFGVWRTLDKASRQGLPTAALSTLAGAPTDLALMAKGKPMVVNLWASWCPPCRREMPVLAAAQKQETQVTFIYVNQAESKTSAERYLNASQLNLANVLLDPWAALGRAIGSTALPTTLFYDASGQLVDTHLGELSAASLASKLERLHLRTAPSNKE